MTAQLLIGGTDVSGVTYTATVSAGRDALDSQPDASVLELAMFGWRPAGQLADSVTLSDEHGTLFHGTVTDLAASLDPNLPDPWRTRVTAVGPLADLGRVVIGDEPWPAETDSQRVTRILDTAGAAHAVNGNVNGPLLLPSDVDRRPALELAQDTAGDALGVLWEQPSDPAAPIRYTPQRLRAWEPVAPLWSELPAGQSWSELPPAMTWDTWTTEHYPGVLTTPSLTLHAGIVLAAVDMSQQIGDLIRRVRIQYGPEVDQGDRAQVVMGDDIPELSRDTRLADEAGATLVADSLWRARREPGWHMTSATLKLWELPQATQAEIRSALAVGTRLTITDIDFDSPIGTQWQGYLEGWVHELDGATHYLTLQVVDRRLVEPSNRWQDIPPTLQWQEISPTLQWQDALGGFGNA
jgi:hypothetical protein